MTISRKSSLPQLNKQPVVLVLAQVRYSKIGNIAKYMPAIEDELRRIEYPLQTRHKTKQVEVSPAGVKEIGELDQWIFKKKDERTSLIIDDGQIVLQTTDYGGFDSFAGNLLQALEVLMRLSDHDKFGVVQRMGLRYIDLIRHAKKSDELEVYLRPSLLGVSEDAFSDGAKRIGGETVGQTTLTETDKGTLAVRIRQNDMGMDLPPDLIASAPPRADHLEPKTLVTIIDTDHYWEGKNGPPADFQWMNNIFHLLHDQIIDAFCKHVVTSKAIELWK